MNWKPFALVFASLLVIAGCNNEPHQGTADGDMAGNGDYPVGPYGAEVGDVIANLAALRVQTGAMGMPADTSLSSYRKELMGAGDKVLVVIGAAEWCGPCKAEQPELVQLFNDYKAQNAGVAFIVVVSEASAGVVAGDPNAQNWATTYMIPFDVASDQSRALAPYFDTKTYPNSMVIKLSSMTITYFHAGKDTAGLKAAVDAALK